MMDLPLGHGNTAYQGMSTSAVSVSAGMWRICSRNECRNQLPHASLDILELRGLSSNHSYLPLAARHIYSDGWH